MPGDESKELELLTKFFDRVEQSHKELHEKMGKKLDGVHALVQDTRTEVSSMKTQMSYELKALQEENGRQNKVLEEQHETLVEHSNRSTQLERDNQLREAQLRAELFLPPSGAIPMLQARIEEAEAPKRWLKGTMWLLGIASAIGGLILLILEIAHYL